MQGAELVDFRARHNPCKARYTIRAKHDTQSVQGTIHNPCKARWEESIQQMIDLSLASDRLTEVEFATNGTVARIDWFNRLV